MRLAGRSAIITGAAGGIGRAIAVAFANAGADLCLADVAPLDAVAATVIGLGRRAITAPADVTRRADVEAMVAGTVAAFGGVDILVNVAGIVSFGSAATLPETEWDRVLAINLKGTFLCCQAVIAPMRARN